MQNTIKISRLSNGMRIVTEVMPGLESATIGIWVNVGARHERMEQNGIAHFLEHIAFKGTHQRNAAQIAKTIEGVGGYINAYTSREITAYYARVLHNDVMLAFDVIADIVLNSIFEPHEIELERKVIMQEIGRLLDTPDDIIFDWLQAVSYPSQPLGRCILGTQERVSAFTRSDFRNFIAEHYQPNNLLLCAAGAVNHEALLAAATAAFGGLQKGKYRPATAAHYQGGEYRQVKSLEQVHCALALEAVGYRHHDIYAAQIYSIALGGGMSSRLFQQVREKRGLCYAIYASMISFYDTGLLTIYAGTNANDIERLLRLVVDELRAAAENMENADFNRARNQLKAGLLMGLESSSRRCERLARTMFTWDRVIDLDEIIENIEAADADKIRDFARRLCANAAPSLALYGPISDKDNVQLLQQRLIA